MDEHTHEIRYTVYMQPAQWWKRVFGLIDKRTYTGIRSSQQAGELLIFINATSFHSLNYARVIEMVAEQVEHSHAPEITAREAARTVDQELRVRGWGTAQG